MLMHHTWLEQQKNAEKPVKEPKQEEVPVKEPESETTPAKRGGRRKTSK